VALLIPGLAYVWIAVCWQQDRISPQTGDEPHYLVIADAITADHSLDVRKAYARDAITMRAYGPVDWENHTRTVTRGVYSVHSPGISAFIALPYDRNGVVGVRVALALLTGLIPLLFFRIARGVDLQPGESTCLAIAASFSLPFLAAAGQIFPDLPSGVMLLALALVILLLDKPVSQPSSTLLAGGLIAAVLPWFHIKNIAPAVILSCAALILDARRDRLTWKRSMRVLVPIAGSLAVLAGYHLFAFGTLLGPFTAESASGATLEQAGMAILGLHLDQAQGVFLQQPLFLLGWVGLVIAFRLSPVVLASLALAYASIALANGVHFDMYGGLAIGGRFIWTVAALWFVPMVLLYRELGRIGKRFVWLLCALSLSWQLVLMTDWVPDGTGPLRLVRSSDLFERNSYFTGEIRRWLPSFYDVESYLSYPQNLWWMAVTASLAVLGIAIASRRRAD
jgi:hypothetical protein